MEHLSPSSLNWPNVLFLFLVSLEPLSCCITWLRLSLMSQTNSFIIYGTMKIVHISCLMLLRWNSVSFIMGVICTTCSKKFYFWLSSQINLSTPNLRLYIQCLLLQNPANWPSLRSALFWVFTRFFCVTSCLSSLLSCVKCNRPPTHTNV